MESSVQPSTSHEVMAAFRSTTMYLEATEPMRQALVMADSVLSEIVNRYSHALPPDVRRDAQECYVLCRRLADV